MKQEGKWVGLISLKMDDNVQLLFLKFVLYVYF